MVLIDTPGHAAFSNMRQRGVSAVDAVILVISGIEGIQAQTIECLKLIRDKNIPYVIALNKIDRPGADKDFVISQLYKHGWTQSEADVCENAIF